MEIECPLCLAIQQESYMPTHFALRHAGAAVGKERFLHSFRPSFGSDLKCWCGANVFGCIGEWAMHLEEKGGLLQHFWWAVFNV